MNKFIFRASIGILGVGKVFRGHNYEIFRKQIFEEIIGNCSMSSMVLLTAPNVFSFFLIFVHEIKTSERLQCQNLLARTRNVKEVVRSHDSINGTS